MSKFDRSESSHLFPRFHTIPSSGRKPLISPALTHLLPSGRKSGKPPRETPEQDSEEAQIIEAYMSALAVIEQLKQPSQEEDAGADGKVSV